MSQILRVFGTPVDPSLSVPWALAAFLLVMGGLLTRRAGQSFSARWAAICAEIGRG